MARKNRILVIALTLVAVIGFLAANQYSRSQVESVYAKKYEFRDINGRSFTLEQFKGKVVIVDFMTTTCESCATLHIRGYMHDFYEKHKGRVEIVSVTVAPFFDNDERLQAYREHFKIPWTMASGQSKGGQIIVDFGVKTTFSHIFLDKEGVPRYVNYAAVEVVKEDYSTILKLIEEQDWAALKKYQYEGPVPVLLG